MYDNRHPSQAAFWEWWDGDEDELHEHRITPNEVYEVWVNGPHSPEISGGGPAIGR